MYGSKDESSVTTTGKKLTQVPNYPMHLLGILQANKANQRCKNNSTQVEMLWDDFLTNETELYLFLQTQIRSFFIDIDFPFLSLIFEEKLVFKEYKNGICGPV